MSKEIMLKSRGNPTIVNYNNVYHIGYEFIYKALILFGDSEYTHNFLKYVSNLKKTDVNFSNYKFKDLINMFDTGDNRPVIENKLNLD